MPPYRTIPSPEEPELLEIVGFKENFDHARENVKQGKVITVDKLKRKY